MGNWPIHPGFSEIVLATEIQTDDIRTQLKCRRPIEGCPEAIFPGSEGLQQVIVDGIIGLQRNMYFKGENLGVWIIDATRR